MVDTVRSNAYQEVYVILNSLVDEDFKKIPEDVITALDMNRNKDYEYILDEYTELEDCKMLPQTKAILFNIFRDYLANEKQREKIKKWQQEERVKQEIKKENDYNVDVFKKNNDTNLNESDAKNTNDLNKDTEDLVEKKENIFTKILEKIKMFIKGKNK